MNPAAVSAVVLAGGASQRLSGRDKGLQLLFGRPLVAWVVQRLQPQVGQLVISANRHADIYAEYARVLADATSSLRGPLAGMVAAFEMIDTPWLLTAPVDCPTPPADLAARLVVTAERADAAAAFVHDGHRRQPLFAVYRRELGSAAAAALAQNSGVWQWQDSVGAVALDCTAAHAAFVNLNTPQDFVDFEAGWHAH